MWRKTAIRRFRHRHCLSRTTMISRLRLKRAVSSTAAPGDAPTKKSKTPMPLETPHPTLESSALVYALPSSVGRYETPRDFSPVPIVSSSRRLKENRAKPPKRTYGKYGKKSTGDLRKAAAALESPFGSSPETEGGEQMNFGGALPVGNRAKTQLALGGPLSTLPLPALTSAPSSPQQRPAVRRPSFDAPPPQITFDIFTPSRDVDFNRPPSQLSLYDYNARTFDADLPALFQSTPKHPDQDYDTESDSDDDSKLGYFAGTDRGYETPDMDDDWNDSLISPPRFAKQPKDVEMKHVPEPEELEELFDSLILMRMSCLDRIYASRLPIFVFQRLLHDLLNARGPLTLD